MMALSPAAPRWAPTSQIPCVSRACTPVSAKNSDPLRTGYLPGGSGVKGPIGTAIPRRSTTYKLLFPPKGGKSYKNTHILFFYEGRQARRREGVRNAGGRTGTISIAPWPLLDPIAPVFVVLKKASRNYGAGRVPSSNQR